MDDPVMTDITLQDALRLTVELARKLVLCAGQYNDDPQPGDLVVEITKRPDDPDAIGYLEYHGDAPYAPGDPTDGSVPMREVWDIRPLNPEARTQIIGGERVQRWENAEFVSLPVRWRRKQAS
jgi:hypothetical protein